MLILKVVAQSGHYSRTDLGYIFPVSQWRGDDPISDIRSPNKEILDMQFVIVHGLTTFKVSQPSLISYWSWGGPKSYLHHSI